MTETPYTRLVAYCPACGVPMQVVTRNHEKATHDAPLVFTCAPCKKSWSVSPTPLTAVAVDFDDGTRAR
jgi:transposase-like protein